MKLDYYSAAEGVDVASGRADLCHLADLVASGGELSLAPSAHPRHLRGVVIEAAQGLVAIAVDDRSYLTIHGGAESRSLFADLLRDVANMDDGGHIHLEYFEGHHFLAPDSVPLIVNSPHGGMPRR
ncbi:Imm32 family immunity protein [Micromonospora sp. CA-259024]|uniref:Imm32 family immunity protein n=1 Tax=Micromonospora sp. CA-259024 TaxID=3239965 RepID=UPI003D8EF123